MVNNNWHIVAAPDSVHFCIHQNKRVYISHIHQTRICFHQQLQDKPNTRTSQDQVKA